MSLEPSRKVMLNLGLTSDTTAEQMKQAMDLLEEIAAGNDGAEENILTGFNAFGDSAMNIIFIYYIRKDADILGRSSRRQGSTLPSRPRRSTRSSWHRAIAAGRET